MDALPAQGQERLFGEQLRMLATQGAVHHFHNVGVRSNPTDRIGLGQLLADLLLIALRHAAGDHDRFDLPGRLLLAEL